MRSSSLPERPTNGRPSMSSSRPGASPTNITRAFGLPSANTSWVAVLRKAQPSKRVQDRAQLLEAGGASCRLARRHDRGVRRLRKRGAAAGRRLGSRRANRWRGAAWVDPRRRSLWWSGRGLGRRVGKPVDRRFADQRVDARLLVEGEKLAGSLVAVSVHSRCAVRPWRNACNHARGAPALKVRLVRVVGSARLVPRPSGGRTAAAD